MLLSAPRCPFPSKYTQLDNYKPASVYPFIAFLKAASLLAPIETEAYLVFADKTDCVRISAAADEQRSLPDGQ